MTIGVDIDGVLTNDDDYILDYGTKYCVENNLKAIVNPYEYETEKFAWDERTLNDYKEQYFWNYVDNEPARRFASEVIKKLKEKGNKIVIITARWMSATKTKDGEIIRNRTIAWLNKNKIEYDKIVFTHDDKKKACLDNKVDIMIEDSPITIPMIMDTIPVLCFDTRYNRNIRHPKVIRVFSWYDIYTKINIHS